MMQQPPTGGGAVHHPSMDQQQHQQQPPPQQHNDGSSPMMMDQQQQLQQQQYSASPQPQPQPQPTTSAQEEEEEEVGMIWIGDLQQWMDEVEEKEVRTLWIGDLQQWMDEAYINLCCFAHTGEVFTSEVIRNKKTGKSECYGFIEFKSHVIAETILKKFNGTPMPMVVGSNFSLNWASSFGLGEKQQQRQEEEEEEDDMLQQETFTTSVKEEEGAKVVTGDGTTTLGGCAPQFPEEIVYEQGLEYCWYEMLKWWSISNGTHTAQAARATHRVHVIGACLKLPYAILELKCVTPAEMEGLFDELLGYVDSIDVVKELHSIDALKPLLHMLFNNLDGIRAKTAKVISTLVQNNPSSRQLVMEANGYKLLYDTFLMDCNPIVETNALDAISSLCQKNDKHSITAFEQRGGYAELINALGCCWGRLQRRCLNLIARLVQEHNSDCNIVTGLEYPSIIIPLAFSNDAEVRKAVFKCLRVLVIVEELVRVEGGNSGQLVKNDNKLKQVLEELIEGINAMAPEDLGAAMEEIQLVDSLWNACYNKPSSLRENGLLVLPGEDALGPPSAATPTF